jgi:hypothetical protein
MDPPVILELKFVSALPAPYKRLLDRFRLAPAPASKYRLATEALSAGARIPAITRGAARA